MPNVDRHIELGLGRLASKGPGPELVRLTDHLLQLLAERAIESQTLQTQVFRQRLEGYRTELAATTDAEAFAELAEKVIETCRDFFKRAEGFEHEREDEIRALVETLTQAITRLAGEATSVNAELTEHSERFGRLVEVEDIRELKRRITNEVTALDRFVAEKQQKEEVYYSTLNKRIDALQSRLRETEEAAALDPLTQIANRGTFDRTIARWTSDGLPFTLALLDIDDFKRVNDTYGHPVGDRVLLSGARKLAKQVRAGDMVARYGGEEFAILLSGATLKQADARMNELLRDLASSVYEFEHEGQPQRLRYTMSCGVAEAAPGEAVESVVRRADEAMYEAKRRGKNCVVCKKPGLLSRVLGA
jgi:diguanylate cyclase